MLRCHCHSEEGARRNTKDTRLATAAVQTLARSGAGAGLNLGAASPGTGPSCLPDKPTSEDVDVEIGSASVRVE
jgi:hypothetical protein